MTNRYITVKLTDHACAGRTPNHVLACSHTRMPAFGKVETYQVKRLKYGNKWAAHIKVDGKYIHLGTFTTKESATRARKDAERAHGFHENHGKEMVA